MEAMRVMLALAWLAVTTTWGQTPVPARPEGFIYQTSSNPMVVIEAFYDHLCPDSKADWPKLKAVLGEYAQKHVTGILHIFPLPYHHNAYFMQQAGVVVRQVAPDKFVHYMELVFANLSTFTTDAVNMTEPQVQSSIANFINQNLDIAKERVLAGFTDPVVTDLARYAWKYAASRGVTGTAQFLVNGVHIPGAPDFSKQQWEDLINQLLSAPAILGYYTREGTDWL